MRKLPSSCLGAFSSATSWVKLPRTSSSRMTLDKSPMGWNVGSTPSRSNSVMGARLSMMAFRVGRHGDDLLRVKANAGVFRDAPHIGLGKMLRHESRSFSGSGRAVAIGTPRFVKSIAP